MSARHPKDGIIEATLLLFRPEDGVLEARDSDRIGPEREKGGQSDVFSDVMVVFTSRHIDAAAAPPSHDPILHTN